MSRKETGQNQAVEGDTGADTAPILVIEDTESLALTYQGILNKSGYTVEIRDRGEAALETLLERHFPVILLDLMLPDMDGLDILKWIHERQIPSAVIIVTAHGSVNIAVEAMRYGAFDFLEKPFSPERLAITVRNALDRMRLTEMVDRIREGARQEYEGFIGSSLPMQAVYRIIDSAATSKASIFITGESGTGKEVCAEALHRKSPRAENPFIALNCAAIPRDLMESEVFGHVKGAFTGANTNREGAAARANGGTLFMDEIAEMDMDLQAKLLRFIQTGQFTKVGGNKLETVDVRFISATNKDPLAEVKAGRFREDLYYRLHVIPIHLPALRERDEDILLIGRYFLRKFSAEEGKNFVDFDPQTQTLMRRYEWPGNVRELQNVIRNVVVLHSGEQVGPSMLPPPLNGVVVPVEEGSAVTPTTQLQTAGMSTTDVLSPDASTAPAGTSNSDAVEPLWKSEKRAIEAALAQCDDNIPRAAALLEISASTIYRKLQSWKELEASQSSHDSLSES